MNMKKLLALLLALTLSLTGLCAAAEQDEDVVLATAYDGAVSVLMSEVKEEFDQVLHSYIAYYGQYGYEMDKYDTDFQNSVAQETVQMKLSQRVAERHAEETGYVLTPELDESYQAQAQAALDEMMGYYKQYLLSYGISEDEVESVVTEELAAAGYTYDTLYESAKLKGVLDHLYALGIEGVEVTEEEVRQAYDAKVEEQKATYDADVDSFINAYLSEEDILYTPENVRLMHCIFTAMDEEQAEATPDEATLAETQDADPLSLSGLARANAVLAKIRAGEDFTSVMEAYNEDSSTAEQMALGYPIAEGSAMYGDEFKAGAMALEHVGDVSDVIVTDYGYFILKYAADIPAGTVDFETRKEAETQETLTNKQNDAYSAYIDGMLNDANIIVNDLSPLFNVYVGESVEATVAYAGVTAETDLTDMPAGDAVAKLAAGATLDVLSPDGTLSGSNACSLLLHARLEDVTLLLTGDLTRDSEPNDVPGADVLKVAHHGSGNSTSDAFLDQASPELALISVGANNRYGHPDGRVLDSLARVGAQVLRTDEAGSITLWLRSGGYRVETYLREAEAR